MNSPKVQVVILLLLAAFAFPLCRIIPRCFIMGDALFTCIERMHGSHAWGRFLDAGTGLHSLKWIQTLPTISWTAITADNGMQSSIVNDKSVAGTIRLEDKLVVGNWMDDSFRSSLGKYDTILADYLIGAVDGFSPYEQDVIVQRLKEHLMPNGRMYFVGMNPIPDEFSTPGSVISEIRRARDACILLAGHRPYREFPVNWMTRHLNKVGLKVVESRNFTILHSEESAVRQIKVGRSKLDYMKDSALRSGMDTYLQDLETRTRAVVRANGGKIALSFDYILSVEHESSSVSEHQGVKVGDIIVEADGQKKEQGADQV